METPAILNSKHDSHGRAILLVTIIATIAAYAGGISGQFVFDDPPQIVNNTAIHSWSFALKYFTSDVWPHSDTNSIGTFYRPVFQLWLLLTYKIGGLNPVWWHLVSLMLHLFVTILIFELARVLLSDEVTAGISALLFGLHPVHVEAVTWISGVTEPLMAVSFVGALLCYLRSRRTNASGMWLATSLLLYACSVLSKETALVLPAIIFLHRWLLDARNNGPELKESTRPLLDSLKAATPYLILTVIYLAARYFALKGLTHSMTPLPLSTLIYTWPSILLFYVRLLLWPFGLSAFYDTPYVTSLSLQQVVIPLLILLLLAVGLYLRSRTSRVLQFFALWIVLPIIPLLNLSVFKDGELAHDRYMYLPSIGLCVLVAIAIREVDFGSIAVLGLTSTQVVVLLILVVVFGIVTFRQTAIWKSDLSLATRGVEIAPGNNMATNNLAKEFALKGDYEHAIPLFKQVLERRPNYWLPTFNLGFVYYQVGNLPEAERYLRKAIQISATDAAEHRYLGFTLLELGKKGEAAESLRQAIKLEPGAPDQYYALATILEERKDYAGALQEFQNELRVNSKNPDVKQKIAELETKLSNPPQ